MEVETVPYRITTRQPFRPDNRNSIHPPTSILAPSSSSFPQPLFSSLPTSFFFFLSHGLDIFGFVLPPPHSEHVYRLRKTPPPATPWLARTAGSERTKDLPSHREPLPSSPCSGSSPAGTQSGSQLPQFSANKGHCRHVGLPIHAELTSPASLGIERTMPSFSNDAYPTATATTTHPRSFDSPRRKSHDKSTVGNTFLWTNWPNGETNHDAHPNDRPLLTNLKNGSAYSLNGPRSSVSSYTRDLPHSKDGSMHSIGNGTTRDPRDGGRPSAMLDRKSSDVGPGAGSMPASVSNQQVNGTAAWSNRSAQGKTMVNGDAHRASADEPSVSDRATSPSTSLLQIPQSDDTGRLSPDPDRLAASPKPSHHRYSSPPAPSIDANAAPDSQSSSVRHRHSLQVPRTPSVRRNSRDLSEDTAYTSGRQSPTTGGPRRTSFSLIRRATKTTVSDAPLDEAPPDEDAARWAEAIKQKRASRRRREDDDDDRVIVGTKVDQNHVNYVTAYNMLTGIRFTVSRINAKMDRELTPADFQAKHKFSFDMYD